MKTSHYLFKLIFPVLILGGLSTQHCILVAVDLFFKGFVLSYKLPAMYKNINFGHLILIDAIYVKKPQNFSSARESRSILNIDRLTVFLK